MSEIDLQGHVIAFGLLLCRVSAFILTSKILGRNIVPNTVKVGLCLALSLFWLADYSERLTSGFEPSFGRVVIAGIMETFFGGVVGYLFSLVMLPARIAGSYVGQELGFSLGQVADPSTGTPNNEAGLLFDAFALVLFWVTNSHHVALRALGVSTNLLQLDRNFLPLLTPRVVEMVSNSHSQGIMLIVPLAALLFLVLVYLSVVMRAWPQMTLFSFGMGARLLIGLIAFAVFLPQILYDMAAGFEFSQRMIEDMLVGSQ